MTFLLAGNFTKAKFNHEGVFIRLFMKAVSDLVQDLNGSADNLEYFFFK